MKKLAPNSRSFGKREVATLLFCFALAAVLGAATVFATTSGGSLGALVMVGLAGAALIVIVNDPRRVLLAVAIFDIPLLFDIYIGHDEYIGVRGTTSGYNISLTTIALVGLYALWFWERISRERDFSARRTSPQTVPLAALLPLFAYCGFAIISAVFGQNLRQSLFELFILGQLLLLYLYVIYRARSREDVAFIALMLAGALLFESLVMFGTRVIGRELAFGPLKFGVEFGETGMRIGGTLRNANVAGSYLALSISICAGIVLSNLKLGTRVLAGAAILSAVPALIFTQSRGGWLSLALAMVLFVGFAWRSGRISGTLLAGGAIVALGVLLVFQNSIVNRILADDRGSASARGPLNQIALNMVWDYPLTGVGINNFLSALPPYLRPEFRGAWISTVHNRYLLMWSETGLGGLLTFMLFIAATLYLGWRVFQNRDALYAPLALGLCSGVVGQLVHMAFDTYRWRSSVQLLFLMSGMLVVMHIITPLVAARNARVAEMLRYHEEPGTEISPA
jgi:putative inorganic carbon (hco3(-)) transporter